MAEEMANITWIVISIPRRCMRQTMRNNIAADTPEIYWHRIIFDACKQLFVIFPDHLLQEFDTRFSAIRESCARSEAPTQ